MPLRRLPGQEGVRRQSYQAMRQSLPADRPLLPMGSPTPLGRRGTESMGQAHLPVGYLGRVRQGAEPAARVAAGRPPAAPPADCPPADCPLAGPAEGAQSHLDGIR